MASTLENNNSHPDGGVPPRTKSSPSPSFTVPPRPILNKSDHKSMEALPKLQTSASQLQQQLQQQLRTSTLDSPSYNLVTPINQTPSSASILSTPGGTKITFNVPSGVEKSHRGSISARPSQVNVGGGSISSPAPAISSRQPSHNLIRNPSLPSASSVDPTATATTATTSTSTTVGPLSSTTNSNVNNSSSANFLSNPLQRRTSPSPYSSRQNSSNVDYVQFFPKSSMGHEFGSVINESRSNSVCSNISFLSPNSVTGSDLSDNNNHTLNGGATFVEPVSVPKKKKAPLKTVVASPTGPVVPFTQYLQREDDKKIHILIGATGSVATIKIPLIIDKLQKIYGPEKVSIQLVVTKPAEHFLRGLKISSEVKIWRDSDEWSNTFGRPGDPILHVELRKWADILLIAPLSANTLLKIANGLCDNLLTSIVRSWNPTIPIFVAPAMNTLMYTHPMTKKHLNILAEDFKFITVLKPVEKVLVCGDIGMGGMREWTDIVDTVMRKIKEIKLAKLALLNSENNINVITESNGEENENEQLEEDEVGEEDEDDDSDDDQDEDNSSDDDDDDDSDDTNSEIEDDDDELDMEIETDAEKINVSVENLAHHLSNVISFTGDRVKDHRFNSTPDLI